MVVRSDIRGALEDHVAAQHENANSFTFVNQDEFGPSRLSLGDGSCYFGS